MWVHEVGKTDVKLISPNQWTKLVTVKVPESCIVASE